MKDFNEFRDYVFEHGVEIEDAINQKVQTAMKNEHFDDVGAKHEFYRHAWVENGTMEILEKYHNWLSNES